MGIQGLLPVLKSIITPLHVRSYAGKKAAIDTYSWLHKAAFSCSKEICEGRPTDKFIEYCMRRVNLLRHFGVQPVLVFDGGVLPMKADQEAKRARSRKENLERAQEHERLGNRSAALEAYQKAVDITPALAWRLIKVLQREGVQYVVAPYEADAQMAFLANHGHVDVIITEDSDLIAYGCPRVFFKMDKSGQGEEFQFVDIVRNVDPKFGNFTKQMVLEMCVMAGCDYLPSLPGMGIKRAHGLIHKFRSYQKVIRHLRFRGVNIAAEYEESFQRAILTFRHQRVYDPVGQKMVHLTDVPDDVTVDLEFVGPDLPQELVKGIAEGNVDPSTNLPFEEVITPVESARPKFVSNNLSKHFIPPKPVEKVAQKNLLTNYFLSEPLKAKKQFKAPRAAPSPRKQTENRPVNDILSFLEPETRDFANIPDDIFGSPLPDDDDDSAPRIKEAHVNVPALQPQERTRRRPGVLQDSRPLERFSFPSLSSESPNSAERFPGKERKKSIVDVPPFKRSGYFSHSPSVRSQASEPRSPDFPTSTIDTQLKEVESCSRVASKKIRIGSREVAFEKVGASASGRDFDPYSPFDDIRYTRKKSAESCPNPYEIRTQVPFSHSLSQDGARSEVGNFSTNVAHIEQYANIAQKSVDDFVQGKKKKSVDDFAATMESFRWSAKGARASGLRAPMTPITNSTRIAHSTVGATLKKFAYQPSSFKPPSRTLTSRPTAATGAVRAQDNTCLAELAWNPF